jgi:hypothetical protein
VETFEQIPTKILEINFKDNALFKGLSHAGQASKQESVRISADWQGCEVENDGVKAWAFRNNSLQNSQINF